jgi:hypothetical protein
LAATQIRLFSVNKATAHDLLATMIGSSETPAAVVKELAMILLESLSSEPNTVENKEQLRKLLARLRQRHPEIFSEASSNVIGKRNEDGRTQIEQLVLSLSVVSEVIVSVDYLPIPFPLDEFRFYTVDGGRGESCRSHNRICGLGFKYTRSSSAWFVGGEWRG